MENQTTNAGPQLQTLDRWLIRVGLACLPLALFFVGCLAGRMASSPVPDAPTPAAKGPGPVGIPANANVQTPPIISPAPIVPAGNFVPPPRDAH